MKQKFYSQVNMERIFFFDRAASGSDRRPQTGGAYADSGLSARVGSARSTAAMSRRVPTARSPSSPTPTRPRRRRWPKATGAKVADVDAILASKDVDAVAICSPTDTHADLIERAARAGKAIFCEKPIDLDVEPRSRLPRSRQRDRRDADGRLQPPLRPEFRRAAQARRGGRDRRARNRLDHLARSRRRRRSPISPARAASSAT